ncbi:MAG: DeoR/GlpR transcriptional regulator [Ruminococcaceae bacterium]|nr:DeoR/GlpR transcriptional regulator [Oscillospiraceae bacterium]
MYDLERQEEILRILEEKKSVSVHSLAERLYSSESTIRRDLSALERSGRVRRTFGGAVLEESNTKEVPLFLRQAQNGEKKRIIAEKAARLVENGKVIFLDASTTVAYLVPHLKQFKNLTVITNSPNTSLELGRSGITSYCTGGRLLESSEAYVGGEAEDFIRRFNADIMFFSSRGITDDGYITDSSAEESQIRRVMMANSAKKYYLYDESKLGKKYLCNICSVADIDAVIGEIERSF